MTHEHIPKAGNVRGLVTKALPPGVPESPRLEG